MSAEFVRIFCSPPIALLPSCQPGADGAPPQLGEAWCYCSTPPCRKPVPAPGTPAPSRPSFCVFRFCAKMAVTSLKSKYRNREQCGSHYPQACVYTHTHIVAQARLLVVMCRAVWFVNQCSGFKYKLYNTLKYWTLSPPLLHWLYQGVSII